MIAEDIAAGFQALAHPLRVQAISMLVTAGDAGLAAGAISTELGVAKNTLSPHLVVLARAALVSSKRNGRSIIYRADLQQLQRLWMAFPLSEEVKLHLSASSKR
ncbi:MAG TPA: metalloregulator ArsR/SmtB family transcription factor [Allosphingosinicella sp.]|nr:metalloregulator ArsR/SmtB family transcription factor [Allosphingosinicella sp.]